MARGGTGPGSASRHRHGARSASARDGAIWARRLHGSVARGGSLSGPVARTNFHQPRCRAITPERTNADRARWTRAPAVPPRVRAARRLVALTCRGRLGRSGGLTALVLRLVRSMSCLARTKRTTSARSAGRPASPPRDGTRDANGGASAPVRRAALELWAWSLSIQCNELGLQIIFQSISL